MRFQAPPPATISISLPPSCPPGGSTRCAVSNESCTTFTEKLGGSEMPISDSRTARGSAVRRSRNAGSFTALAGDLVLQLAGGLCLRFFRGHASTSSTS